MIIAKCMKKHVVSIHATATIQDAADIFTKKHIGLLPIVDDDDKPIGVVGIRDLLTLELPDFVNMIADLDFVHDFGAVEITRPSAEALAQPVTTLMKQRLTVEENCGLLRAYALMLQHNMHDILVVSKKGKLVGIASRVDVGVAILSSWPPREEK